MTQLPLDAAATDAAPQDAPGPASGSVRTRFAPSPSGRLHLGNLRIAAFGWLFTRRHGGQFILRIEDTDEDRNVDGSEELLLDDMRWLGLEWDEGPDIGGPHAPYRQTDRADLYRRVVDDLLAGGSAYRCWCGEEELREGAVETAHGEVFRYSGKCRRLSDTERADRVASGKPAVVRFAVPEGDEPIVVRDEVRGDISFPHSDLHDFVIQRADGTPTYHLAVVADDVDMRITHVIRHQGHLPNTPKHALLFDAMGQGRPLFVHLPTVLAPGGGKLSKRHGSAGAEQLRGEGYDPEGVLNYLSLLGWSSPDGREVLTRQELIDSVSLERLGHSDTVLDPEKLKWLSGQHIARRSTDELVSAIEPFLDRGRIPLSGDALRVAAETVRSRLKTYSEANEHIAGFFPSDDAIDGVRSEVAADPAQRRVIEVLAEKLTAVDAWVRGPLDDAVRAVGKEVGVKGPGLFHPVRRAITGEESGPDLAGIMAAIGREETLRRTRQTLAKGALAG
jgi:nondiscriminating glutamyl-tRNA synthetase